MESTHQPPRLLLVGGGLQSALVALAALVRRPGLSLTVLEREDRPAGNHTWSFHDSDVPPSLQALMRDLAEHRWSDYDVHFPTGPRRVGLGYATFGSDHLARVLSERLDAAPAARLRCGAHVEHVDAGGATLAGGERVTADLVIDARGPRAEPDARCGYQKFYGVELELAVPHGLDRPVVMDATVEQVDGFRFLYLLPFSPTRLLVEDTVFSASPTLDTGAWRERVLGEARARGWEPAHVVRSEQGVLPMPWAGEGPELQSEGPLRGGYQGRWFHPATGFSMPQALRLAECVARHVEAPARLFGSADYEHLVRAERTQARFARFLNRLLFTGVKAPGRWTVFERFYRHPEAAIARFYAGRLTRRDRARMLIGKPPRGFSLGSALAGRAIA